MMHRTMLLATGLCLSTIPISPLSLAAEPMELPADLGQTWLELDAQVYGAKPDGQGPLGGGEGYVHIVSSGDYTARNAEQLIAALSAAKPGQIVFIPGETEIDLTTLIYIDKLMLQVPQGVTLAGNRGQDGSRGALLTSDALDTPIMIEATGPDVRITGLRIRGPNSKRYLDHHRRAFGPGGDGHAYYYKFPTQDGIRAAHDGLVVDNCNISGFGHAAIYLTKGQHHKIHHNFIHHCQYNGLGYGVSHDVASSTIEFNVFEANRHSIAGTGRPGCSYVARHNLELGTSLSHCFDMHGGRDRKDNTDIAGTAIEICNNTFRAPQTPVVIRGTPDESCAVHHNLFPQHSGPGQAVRAEKHTVVSKNAYGPKPSTAK